MSHGQAPLATAPQLPPAQGLLHLPLCQLHLQAALAAQWSPSTARFPQGIVFLGQYAEHAPLEDQQNEIRILDNMRALLACHHTFRVALRLHIHLQGPQLSHLHAATSAGFGNLILCN